MRVNKLTLSRVKSIWKKRDYVAHFSEFRAVSKNVGI